MSIQPNRKAMKCGDIFICIKIEWLHFNLASICLDLKVCLVLKVEKIVKICSTKGSELRIQAAINSNQSGRWNGFPLSNVLCQGHLVGISQLFIRICRDFPYFISDQCFVNQHGLFPRLYYYLSVFKDIFSQFNWPLPVSHPRDPCAR